MALKIRKRKPGFREDGTRLQSWERGSRTSGSSPSKRRGQTDVPPYIDYKTGKLKDGERLPPGDMPGLKQRAVRVQNEVLRFFEEGHLNTGDFSRWVRATKSNTMAFYAWILRDLMPKSVQLSVIGGEGAGPEEMPLVVRIEQRKAK